MVDRICASRQYATSKRIDSLGFSSGASVNPKCLVLYFKIASVSLALKRGRCHAPEAPKIVPVSDAVVEATLPHLTAVVADMVRLQRLLGCRPGEICDLTPRIIDRSKAVWGYLIYSWVTSGGLNERGEN